jgi:uncharacterized protein YcnI
MAGRSSARVVAAAGVSVAGLSAAGLSAAVVALGGASAYARITVDPVRSPAGGYTTLAFSVPSDRADVSTTKVEIRFPDDHPLAGLTTEPKPGWDVTVDRIRAASPSPSSSSSPSSPEPEGYSDGDRVSGVTWSASSSDAAVRPGRFEVFRISVGPLPSDVDVLKFDARQTYSDGEVVAWDGDPATDPDETSATPAPFLALAPAAEEASAAVPLPAATTTPEPSREGVAAGAPSAEPTEPTLETERVSAATAAGEDDRAARVAYGLGAGAVLILGAVGLTAAARRRGGDAT